MGFKGDLHLSLIFMFDYPFKEENTKKMFCLRNGFNFFHWPCEKKKINYHSLLRHHMQKEILSPKRKTDRKDIEQTCLVSCQVF